MLRKEEIIGDYGSHYHPRHEMKFYIILHDGRIDGLVERGQGRMVMAQMLHRAAKNKYVEIHDRPRLEETR